jgi:predicted MFS family arabinose efflux permease
MPASPKLVLAATVPAERADVVGIMTADYAAAQTAGAPLLGLVAGPGGFRLAFAAGAAAPAAALLLQARRERPAP